MILLERLTPKHSIITFTNGDQLHFFDGKPAALDSAGVVYFETQPPAGMKMVNSINLLAPHIRMQADEFDFLVGQVLVKAGLPLTRRSSND